MEPEALISIAEKLKRADEYILDLKSKIHAFINETSDGVLSDRDSHRSESFRRFHENRIVPHKIRIQAGEAIYHMRSSLDHAACALILRDGGKLGTKSQFPIFYNRPTCDKQVRDYQAQIHGITRSEVLTVIESHQPYKRRQRGSVFWLSVLKQLSNIDKHRALTMQVVDVQPVFKMTIREADQGTEPSAVVTYSNGTSRDVEIVKVDRQLVPEIVFAEYRHRGHQMPVADGLRHFHMGVVGIISDLIPYF